MRRTIKQIERTALNRHRAEAVIERRRYARLVIALSLMVCVLAADLTLGQQRRALNPDDVFISEDTDTFDPGLPIGAQFPAILALYQGQEITEIDQFIRDKGAVFLANRSVDW